MQDAVVALQSALAELHEAKGTLPDDLALEVQQLIEHTERLLAAVRQTGNDG